LDFFKDCNRGCFNDDLVYDNNERLPTVPGCFITSEDRGSIAKGSIDKGNYRDKHNRRKSKPTTPTLAPTPNKSKKSTTSGGRH
jgi:hypothetical protein